MKKIIILIGIILAIGAVITYRFPSIIFDNSKSIENRLFGNKYSLSAKEFTFEKTTYTYCGEDGLNFHMICTTEPLMFMEMIPLPIFYSEVTCDYTDAVYNSKYTEIEQLNSEYRQYFEVVDYKYGNGIHSVAKDDIDKLAEYIVKSDKIYSFECDDYELLKEHEGIYIFRNSISVANGKLGQYTYSFSENERLKYEDIFEQLKKNMMRFHN